MATKTKINNITTRGVGRPTAKVTFPKGKFTASSVAKLNASYRRDISPATIQNHIKAALEKRDIIKIGKIAQEGRGHPTYQYRPTTEREKKEMALT